MNMNFERPKPIWRRPRTLMPYIIERGCPELQELVALRTEGWKDELLKTALNRHFSNARKCADESTAEDDAHWLPIMSSSLEHMDKKINCIPRGRDMRFLDLGCCPGGFSDYILTTNPRAQGVGVSLEVDSGGHGLAIPLPQSARLEMHWADLTFYDMRSPSFQPSPVNGRTLLHVPFMPGSFQLAMLDGHHRRPQESDSTHPWDIDRLLVSQLIIALESLELGGKLIVKLNHLESSTTARILYMLDNLSRAMVAFKPYVHATRGSFYAVASGVGLGMKWNKRAMYLENLKRIWWELTFGGPHGEGRYLDEDDLDFIVDFDTLRSSYLDRIIKLGRGTWRAQGNALRRTFARIREAAAQSIETEI